MLKEIGYIKNIPKFIKRTENKSDPFKLMGFGHKVYKNYDPSEWGNGGGGFAAILKDTCREVLKALGEIKNNFIIDN